MSRSLAFLLFCGMLLGGVASFSGRPILAQPLPDRAPLRGVVVDQDGKPLSKVFLALRRQNGEGTYSFWGADTSSDAQGNFMFPGVEEGDYYLNAELGGFAPLLNKTVPWTKRSDELKIQLTRLANAQLRFLGANGDPLVKQPIWLRLQSATGETAIHRLRTDEAGVVSVPHVIAATYFVWAHTASGYTSQNLELRYSPTPTPIGLQLHEGGSLKVSASDSNGVALGGAALMLTPESADEATRLGSLVGDLNDDFALLGAEGDRSGIVTRDGDGILEMRHLPPGRYSARLVLPGFTSFAPRIVEVQEGATTPLEWHFASRRAGSLTLDLRTIDDKPIAGREVTVRVLPINTNGTMARESVDENGFALPFFPSGTGARRAISDESGRIRLFPIRPGRYRVFVAPTLSNVDGSGPVKESSPLDLDVGESGATASVILPEG